MPASVQIRRWTGTSGSETKTNVTSINSRMSSSDTHSTNSTSNSVLIPNSGTNYSFWMSLRLYIASITAGTVNNIKFYMDGANGFGTGVSLNVSTSTGYVQATGTVGTSGTQLTTANHASLAGAPVDAFGYTSASPLSVTGSATAVGDVGDFVVLQAAIASNASQGTKTAETYSFRYDDTSS